MTNYRIIVLTHDKISGSCLDGSDTKFSKGKEITVNVTAKENTREGILYELAKRQIKNKVVSKLISITKNNKGE